MNHAIKNPMTGEEIDDRTRFVITEGRYYAFMFFISLPHHLSKFGNGGDINGLLWKHDDEPGEWTFQFRFRQYRDKLALDSNDEKIWYAIPFHGKDEPGAREEAEEVLQTMVGLAGGEFNTELTVHRLEIGGDNLKFFQVVQEQKPFWMHTQQVRQE